MQIIITPEDIIKRCLWLEYKRFCLKDKDDGETKKIIEENKPPKSTYMQTNLEKKVLNDPYSDERTKALNAASSFGKGKMISESEKMIMAKNKKPVVVKKTVKVMKKPMM